MKRFFQRRRRAHPQEDAPLNEYYEKVSEGVGLAQVVLYSLLFCFVVLSFFRNTHLITYRNFYNFFKDLNAATGSFLEESVDSVTYPTDTEQSFAVYRKGLAVAGNNSVTVFTAAGRQTVSQSLSYRNPVAVGSGKYLLVYERGGTHYSLYNSYAQIFTGTTEYPINDAAVSDCGMYALVTAAAEYNSVVSLYNERFALINRYNKIGYVMDVSIEEKGSLITILTLNTEKGIAQTELMICEPGKAEAKATATLDGTVGWSCFASSNRVTVLHESGVVCYSANGSVVNETDFFGASVAYALLDKDGATVCLNDPANSLHYRLLVLDKNGKARYDEVLSYKPGGLARSGDSVFWTTDAGVCRLDLNRKEIKSISCDTSKRVLLAIGEDEILLCSPQKGEYFIF